MLLRTPQPIGGLDAVSQVSCGSLHCCALQEDGQVLCWGAPFGQTPTLLEGVKTAVAVTVADTRTCVVDAQGEMACRIWAAPLEPIDGLPGVTQLDLSSN